MKRNWVSPTVAGFILAGMVAAISTVNLLVRSPLLIGLERTSYDWLFDIGRVFDVSSLDERVVIVYLDDESHQQLDQPFNRPWDRGLHARLLDRLTAESARLVVFDILFSDPGPDPATDDIFREAIERNGRVLLAADYVATSPKVGGGVEILSRTLVLPDAPFLDAAAGWGTSQLLADNDFVVRQHFHSDQSDSHPSLSWRAAELLGSEHRSVSDPLTERWLRYYGGPESVSSVSYQDALSTSFLRPGYFSDKIVVIGARPMTGLVNERRDELRSPHSVTGPYFRFMPAVEFHATQLLNLLRQDWLRRPAPLWELALLILVSISASTAFVRRRPTQIAALALGGLVLTLLLVSWLFHSANLWFVWMAVVVVPLILAATGAVLYRTVEWYVVRRQLQLRTYEAQLRIAEQAELLDKAHDAIILHDFNWKILFWNRGAETTYGWNSDDAVGRDIRELIKSESSGTYEVAREKLLIEGEWQGELNQTNREKKQIVVASRWSLIRDENGQPKKVLLINTDVTERRELEAQFLRTQRMESIGTLAGGIAHDLNNVLGPIMMGIDLVRMRIQDERLDGTLSRMSDSTKRGADLVKQVLTFARGHEGERMPIQLSHLVKEMKKIVQETFPRNIEIKTSEDPRLPPILADATQVHQILLNLCVNARDAMSEGGAISISTHQLKVDDDSPERRLGLECGEYVRLEVADTGSGIPESIREKIFEPFFTTKELGKGTGLGLSTVNTIVRNHGGALEVLSEPGEGTTFNIFLPEAVGAVVKSDENPTDDQLRAHGQRVVVVDDEGSIRDLAQAALMEFGYRVETACNGLEAMELLESMSDPPDVILTDIMMPGMDGTRLIKSVRKRHPQLPIIAMSGLLESVDVGSQKVGPHVRLLAKPFAARQLVAAVHKELAKQELVSLEAVSEWASG